MMLISFVKKKILTENLFLFDVKHQPHSFEPVNRAKNIPIRNKSMKK